MEFIFSLLMCSVLPVSFQTEELYQVIEGQDDTIAKLREMLHQSQLGQLHVCEGDIGQEARLCWGSALFGHSSDFVGLLSCSALVLLVIMIFTLFPELRGYFSSSTTGGSAWSSECFVLQPAWNTETPEGSASKRTPAGWCQRMCAVCRGCSPRKRTAERGILET